MRVSFNDIFHNIQGPVLFQLNNADISVGEGFVEQSETPFFCGIPSRLPAGDHAGLRYVLSLFC